MEYSTDKSIEVLERTPLVLEYMLEGLSEEWVMSNEGNDTFSPFDVVGHLIHGEKTDWMVRLEVILSDGTDKTFEPFDRFAQFNASKGKTIGELLAEFKELRMQNLKALKSKELTEGDLAKTGRHPELGIVTAKKLIATWAVHDLNHIAQIARVMAKQYKHEVGPWKEYLPVLSR